MASNYKKIAEEHKRDYGRKTNHLRFYKQLYNDKTHFVYELIQNADDSKSQHLELQLDTKTLLVWNDGRQFDEADVRNICSVGSSDKDLTQIGNFGIGFKAVYNYTDLPEIYSNDERFRIRDFIKPEGIDEMTPEIAKLTNNGKTVFRLPFKDILRQEKEITRLENRLRNLSKERSLLFLRHLEKIEWKDKRNAQTGSYSCHRCPYDKIQNASEVELTVSLNGSNQSSETFLIFRKEVQPPQDVTNELLYQAEDVEEQQRIQRAATEPQAVEVAFKLQDGRITAMDDNCVLFAYLPTQKETHLKFLLQARYQTTPARDNIPKPSENPWNEWLVRETADFLPEILEQLKASGLLEPAFFDVLPLKGEVEKAFKPIAKTLRKAMRERILVPTQDGGYAKAENVLYPHDELLRELFESSWLRPNSSWLHPDIQDKKEFYRRFTVMQKARVEEIDFRKILRWLEKQDAGWFEDKSNEWLCSLYTYLGKHQSELERIKKLPLVRLENERHVCACEAFFPPDTDEGCEEIEPFISEMPILQSTLLEEDEHDKIKNFLRNIGVREPHPEDIIQEWIIPQYSQSNKPSVEVWQNYQHVRYLSKVWDKLSGYQYRNLREKISETPILRAYNGVQPKTCDFVKPCDAYLPKAYTGDDDLETYFSVYNDDIWFIDNAYLESKSDAKVWFQFLKKIGAVDTPRIIKKNIPVNYEECSKRHLRGGVTSTGSETIEDRDLQGLSTVLDEISRHKNMRFSKSLWHLLVKVLPSSEKDRDVFFQGIYRYRYRSNTSLVLKPFPADFYHQLKETVWIPDEQGEFRLPFQCFAPTDDNRRLLGNSVAYLHPDFDVSQDNESAQWLAKKLGIHLNANAGSVINYLQTLSGTETSLEKVKPLYHFLAGQASYQSAEFKQKSLIFTSNPEPRWWRVDEVFWEDESEIFKNDRGYLKAHYPSTLESFFTDLGVSPQASQRDYALGIQEIATTEQVEDQNVRKRVQRLYKCLEAWRKGKWEIIYDSRCWLGKKGEAWGFFTRQELILKDHPHIGEIFEGEAPFWPFNDDLSDLARNLKVEGCSQAQVKFHPDGDQEEDTSWSKKVRNLRPYLYAFLNSPRLCEGSDIFMSPDYYKELQKEKLARFSTNCSVQRVEGLKAIYELKGMSVTDPNPRQSFLDVTGPQAKLWLGLEVNESEYPELIGDALQDHFRVQELGRFVENLLTKDLDKVLSRWKRKGLETKLLYEDSKDNEDKPTEFIDEKLLDKHDTGETDSPSNESDMRTSIGKETPKTDNEDNDSLTDKTYESETHFSGSRDDDSKTSEPESETPFDSETTEIDRSDSDSTSDEPESSINVVSDIRNISSPDTQSSAKTGSETIQNVSGESESEMPTVHENPETGNENNDLTEDESETATYQPRPGGSRIRPRGDKAINTPNGNQGTGHNSSRSGGREDDTHIDRTDTSPHTRKEVEHAGMKHAHRHEKKEGRTPKDVSSENRGYDIHSTSPDGKNRCIEVKARDDHAFVVLTSNEWSVAKQLKDNYFLYVVLNARTQPELYIIQNPADVVRTEEWVDVRYQVPLSEIREHGIPV